MKLANLVRLNESQKKWNSLDVSRKAEKELSNSEWNKRVAEKLAILKKLNSDGKFKKDWDEETLQGWVDKNYSWEKVEGKFKPLKEALGDSWKTDKFGGEENAPKYIGGDLHNASIEYKGKKYTVDFTEPEVGGEENPEDATSYKPEYDEPYNMIYRARVDGIEFEVEADMLGFQTGEPEGDITLNYDKNSLEIRWGSLDANEVTSEGSCGYSQEAPGGKELDTPGDTQGMDGDDRTRTMLRKLIRKEIANLQKEEPNEGNAFGAALQQAKDAGEEEFEFQGKKYTT